MTIVLSRADQGEANGEGQGSNPAAGYRCLFPAAIRAFRRWFDAPSLPFGFTQIAGFNYGNNGQQSGCKADCLTHNAADLRQAQLSALALSHVFMSTAIDSGDWFSQHPSDKQTPSRYLANQALAKIFNASRHYVDVEFPTFAGHQSVVQRGGTVTVTVALRAGFGTKQGVRLTTAVPFATTQSSVLGCMNNGTPGGNAQPVSVPRNMCPAAFFPASVNGSCLQRQRCATALNCGYPAIYGQNGSVLNATASIGIDGSSIVLSAQNVPTDFKVLATSLGRGDWPMTRFFSEAGLPVLPWFANLSTLDPWTRPPVATKQGLG